MALFMKQDFTPPILSRKWIAIKCRPNILLHSRQHVIAILESGLLFREDSIEVEQDAPPAEAVWRVSGGTRGGWFTSGERAVSLLALCVGVGVFPPRSLNRSTLFHLLTLASIPVCVRVSHRLLSRRTPLRRLLSVMRDYLALSRRAQACIKELSVLCRNIESIWSLCKWGGELLSQQQSSLSVLMSRASSSLLGNAPWLHADVAWDPLHNITNEQQLMKIHHAFLVIQSTLLKHIAMAHFIQPHHAQQIYKNHNERLYWLHNVLLEHLYKEFLENFEALDRMYRLLKNVANNDDSSVRKQGFVVNNTWLYSDVHSGIATACLELKITLNKCTSLDLLLDSIAQNQQEIDLVVLNKDIDDLVEALTRCLNTTQNAQLRLKKLKSKFSGEKETVTKDDEELESEEELSAILKIEDKDLVVKDEVFYFVKTEDDEKVRPASDVTTEPGKKERETTQFVLNELKRKLVQREDVMRERERQALINTMPELKDNLPEFPRQISLDVIEKKGYISKLTKKSLKKVNSFTKIKQRKMPKEVNKGHMIRTRKYFTDNEIPSNHYEVQCGLKNHKSFLTISKKPSGFIDITKWYKDTEHLSKRLPSASALSDIEASTTNKVVNEAVNKQAGATNPNGNEARNFKFSKKDLELSPSSSESDFENYFKEQQEQMSPLKGVRRRVTRRKNYPTKRCCLPSNKDDLDESSKPMQYSFGTGMALASMFQVYNKDKVPNMAEEEVFIGDGEVSNDSGNDEDA